MKRILIVEDDDDLRGLVERVFLDRGCEVAVAHDGADGIELLHAQPPDLLILDLILPGLDGWAVLEHLRGRASAPAVVVMSVRTEYESVERASREGVAAYVEKPFSVRELVEVCEEVLDGRRGALARLAGERRTATRHLLRVAAEVLAEEGDWRSPAEVLDLSTGGARIAVPTPLPHHGLLHLDFELPDEEGPPLHLASRVQWLLPSDRGLSYGVSFVSLDPEDRARLVRVGSLRSQ
jgi:DNA-binding response OmpR family regulator